MPTGHGHGGHGGGGGGGHRHHGGYRRPYYGHGGPQYYWNGVYWVSPQGLCYTKDEEGVYTLVDCAPVVISNFMGTEGSSTGQGKGGVGGTMDSSMFTGNELREGGPLNKSNLRDTLIGIAIGIAALYVFKKFVKK